MGSPIRGPSATKGRRRRRPLLACAGAIFAIGALSLAHLSGRLVGLVDEAHAGEAPDAPWKADDSPINERGGRGPREVPSAIAEGATELDLAVCVAGAVRSFAFPDVVGRFQRIHFPPNTRFFHHLFVGEELSMRGQHALTKEDAAGMAAALGNSTAFRLQYQENEVTCGQMTTGKFHKIAACMEMIDEYSQKEGVRFKAIAFVRPDLAWQCAEFPAYHAIAAADWYVNFLDEVFVISGSEASRRVARDVPKAQCCNPASREPLDCFLDGLEEPRPNFIQHRHFATNLQERQTRTIGSRGQCVHRIRRTSEGLQILREMGVQRLHGKAREAVLRCEHPQTSAVVTDFPSRSEEERKGLLEELLSVPVATTCANLSDNARVYDNDSSVAIRNVEEVSSSNDTTSHKDCGTLITSSGGVGSSSFMGELYRLLNVQQSDASFIVNDYQDLDGFKHQPASWWKNHTASAIASYPQLPKHYRSRVAFRAGSKSHPRRVVTDPNKSHCFNRVLVIVGDPIHTIESTYRRFKWVHLNKLRKASGLGAWGNRRDAILRWKGEDSGPTLPEVFEEIAETGIDNTGVAHYISSWHDAKLDRAHWPEVKLVTPKILFENAAEIAEWIGVSSRDLAHFRGLQYNQTKHHEKVVVDGLDGAVMEKALRAFAGVTNIIDGIEDGWR
ncbi:hypothetical protein ACHAXT_012006 [Thalassiosira profunda]